MKLTLRTRLKKQEEARIKEEKLRHCSYEALLKVKGKVARRMRMLKAIRQKSNTARNRPSIYRYKVFRALYSNAKREVIGYRKESNNTCPSTLVVKTLQEKIKETNGIITRELAKMSRDDSAGSEDIHVLVHRLSLLEKELYRLWTHNQHLKFIRWLSKLNTLDYYKATRKFYAELKSKNRDVEQFGPIVDKKGEISTSRKQCMENWRKFYADLHSGQDGGVKGSTPVKDKKSPNMDQVQAEMLNKQITMEEIVSAIFKLKPNTAAGRDSILSRDFIELINTTIRSEHEHNREIMAFLNKMILNMWAKEKMPVSFKESVIRPFLKDPEKDPTDPSNYRPVLLLNTVMKVYEQVLKKKTGC